MKLKCLFIGRNLRCIVIALLFSLVSCGESNPTIEVVSGRTMGTTYNVKFVSSGSSAYSNSLSQAIQVELDRLEWLMSTYIPDSELSLFNKSEVGSSFVLSDDTFTVIEFAQSLASKSGGEFDITVGPLVDLWGFGAKGKNDVVPDISELSAVIESVGYKNIALNSSDRSIVKSNNVAVDLSAVAKGYAVDKLAQLMKSKGIDNFLVEVGGETRVSGFNGKGTGWRLGIEKPKILGRTAFSIIEVKDMALATSGDYRNFFVVDGERYSHTISPTTGMPVKHNLASVSVLAESCMEADGLATALLVMGEEKGYNFAVENDLKAYFIYRDGDQFKVRMTDGFSSFVLVDGGK